MLRTIVLLSSFVVMHCHVPNTILPSKCLVSVVGSGWGGVYFAYRVSIDTRRFNPKDVCIFEANARLGGRVYTVRDLPEMEDLHIDIGAYRFEKEDHLPSDLIMKKLKLPTKCYDFECKGSGCSHLPNGTSDSCLKVTDVYGNSRYSLPIEVMLAQLKASGAQLFTGMTVTGVTRDTNVFHRHKRTILSFKDISDTVRSKYVLLNIPISALDKLDDDSVIFPDGGGSQEAFDCLVTQVISAAAAKVYMMYDDAWWITKLGFMQGPFNNTDEMIEGNGQVPLYGRYQDGPVKCTLRTGNDDLPVYSKTPIPYGTCWGALQIYYRVFFGIPEERIWLDLQSMPNSPLTYIYPDSINSDILTRSHETLMSFHRKEFEALGYNVSNIAKPKSMYLGTFSNEGTYVGTMSISQCAFVDPDGLWKTIRRPNPEYNVFLANQDFAYSIEKQAGWAVGSLTLVEKILQSELHMRRPWWLNRKWYKENVVDIE